MREEPFLALCRRLWRLVAELWALVFTGFAVAAVEAVRLHDWLAVGFCALTCAASIAGWIGALRGRRDLRQ